LWRDLLAAVEAVICSKRFVSSTLAYPNFTDAEV
jgi:hypothetical protein